MVKVLVLDDEVELRSEVSAYLRSLGHEVTEVGSIRQFHQVFSAQLFDVLLLDRMLPDGDGLALLGELRLQQVRSGVIMFTARDGTQERIEGFRTGADHYVSKPVRMDELAALIEVMAWRLKTAEEWRLDGMQWILYAPDGVPVKLTAQEFDFLNILGRQAGRAVSRSVLLGQMGKDPEHYDPRNLDALVLRLRKKIEEASKHPFPMKTVHGVGYVVSHLKLDA